MQRAKLKFDKFHSVNLNVANLAGVVVLVLMGCLCQPLAGAAVRTEDFCIGGRGQQRVVQGGTEQRREGDARHTGSGRETDCLVGR